MKLIYSDASPYARTAKIFVRELNLQSRVEEIAFHPFDNPQLLIDGNPLCKVPCLFDDNGQGIFDSQVICEYLNDYANGNLFKEINHDWHLKTLYSLTRGLLDSAVAWQQDNMREEMQRSKFWQQRFISSIDRGLLFLESELDKLPQSFSALDVNLMTLLDYLEFRHPDYHWQQECDELKHWWLQQKNRTSITDTAPRG